MEFLLDMLKPLVAALVMCALRQVAKSLRERMRPREAERDLVGAMAREAEQQQLRLAAARQRGYEDLKLMAFGLTVGILLVLAARR